MSRDYQKEEAKRSLWDLDGDHAPKRYRNKGKGRLLEKAEIREELKTLINAENDAFEAAMSEEIDDALYCHFHGPCDACLAKTCSHCNEGTLKRVEANEPYNSAHMMCDKCDSTYVLEGNNEN